MISLGFARAVAALAVVALGAAPAIAQTVPAAAASGIVTARAPTGADDSTAGYNAGDLWNAPQGLFQAQQTAAGQASWVPLAISGYPIDAIGGVVPIAAYGTRKLRSAYTGAAFNVVRASDSTALDVAFMPSADIDTNALDAFCAGTTCVVAIWYDQSGNAFNATAAAVNRPSVYPLNLTGTARSIVFDSVINGVTKIQKAFTLPAGVAAAGNAVSMFFVARSYTSERTSYYALLANASHNYQFALNPSGVVPPPFLGQLYLTGRALNNWPSNSPHLTGASSSSGYTNVYYNNLSVPGAAEASFPLAGGFIGAHDIGAASRTGYVDMAAVLIYARGLSTTAEIPALQASLTRSFGLTPQVIDNLVIDGDSITEGYQSTFLQHRPRLLERLLGKPFQIFDKGFYGDTIAHRVTNYPADVAPIYNPLVRNNIVEIFAGTNDNDGSDPTGLTLYNNAAAYVAEAHATGFKVLIGDMLPRASFNAAMEAERQAFNILVSANRAGADAVIYYSRDPTMGPVAATANTALYADGTHPTSYGYSILAMPEARAINAVTQ